LSGKPTLNKAVLSHQNKTTNSNKMGKHTAFFYGTLMAPEVLHRVCYGTSKIPQDQAAFLSIKPAILHDYCRHRVRWADYPGIIPEKGHTVRGSYVTGLTDGDIWRLDRFEGGQYKRKEVRVKVLKEFGNKGDEKGEGEEVVTQTYIFIAGDDALEKGEWDYDVFRREKMHRWADHSEEYDEVDEAVESEGYDPTGGRGIKGDMSSKHHGKAEAEEDVPKIAV